MTKDEVIALIQDSDLDDAAKSQWVERIGTEGLTQDVVNALKEAFQDKIDSAFAQLGVSDSDLPELAEKQAEMESEIASAETEYKETMDTLDKEAKQVEATAAKAFDALEAEKAAEDAAATAE